MRIGHGYDVHRFIERRPLVLAGVTVPYGKGLLGHSDADIVAHVVMDALLGACALGDIGGLFPDTDPRYKDANSMELLLHVIQRITQQGYALSNLDVTLIAQRPILAPHIPAMREHLRQAFACDISQINIKATTEEGLGFTGTNQGMAAHAVCLLQPVE